MYVVSEDGCLVNLNAVRRIEVVGDYPDFRSYSVCADDSVLFTCKTEEEGMRIIEHIANAIKGGVKVYQGKFKA